ncbi:MAG: HAMP domain-containing protein [Armatimonadetes bacterium]|nr:HAMP domain-containing protein [Armatimonadota bacterium]
MTARRVRLTSVRTRLTLWNTGALALALVGFAFTVHTLVQVMLIRAIDDDLTRAVRPIARDASRFLDGPPLFSPGPEDRPFRGGPPPLMDPPPLMQPPPPDPFAPPMGFPAPGGPPPPMPGGPGGRRPPPNVIRFRGRDLAPRVLDVQGNPLFPRSPDAPWDRQAFHLALKGSGEPVMSTLRQEDAPLRVLSMPVLWQGKPMGVVQLAHPLTETYELMRELDRTLLLLIPLALFAAGFGGAFLTDRALRPVRRISLAAEQIGAEDLSRRLPESGGDEFAELAANFNRTFDRLEKAFLQLEAAYEQQRLFTADASHELRTPLTVIKANTSLALSGTRTPEQYRQALQASDDAADTMGRIVRDLLLLARSDSGQLAMEAVPVPVGEVLRRAVAATSGREGTAALYLADPDPALMTCGDPHHLERLFINLLDNAIRHTPPEGRISLQARAEGETVLIKIKDTGEGIPPEHLPHLCERFYRVDTSRARAQGGFGLGLSICRSIAEAHGGALKIESTVGVGTTVTVTLPRAEGRLMIEKEN